MATIKEEHKSFNKRSSIQPPKHRELFQYEAPQRNTFLMLDSYHFLYLCSICSLCYFYSPSAVYFSLCAVVPFSVFSSSFYRFLQLVWPRVCGVVESHPMLTFPHSFQLLYFRKDLVNESLKDIFYLTTKFKRFSQLGL